MKQKIPLSIIAIALCCMLVLLPSLCSILYFNNTVSLRLEDTARETISFYIRQSSAHTSSILDTLRNCIFYLMSDERTNAIMKDMNTASQYERLQMEEGLGRVFFISDRSELNAITGIYLVKNEQDYLSILRGGNFHSAIERMLQVYADCGSYNSARDFYTTPANPGYCYYLVDYLDLQSMQSLGKIIIELQAAHLIDTTYLDAVYQQAIVMLHSTDGRMLYSTAEFPAIDLHLPVGYMEAENVPYYHDRAYLAPNHMQIDVFVPKKEILETVFETLKIYIFFVSAILCGTILLGIVAMLLLSKPLRQMLQKIDALATGDLSVRMPSTPYVETERMVSAFNEMADRLEEVFHEVYTKGLLLREAEFHLLESQIRPHFIFNVLELINMRCLAAGQNGICQTVSNLAQLLRANIVHKHEQTITFQEELRYVRYYLELQKERFEDKLHYEIELEDSSILQLYLPKLTIQPLVENSITHGLEPKRQGGNLTVAIWEEEEALYIRVSDDGVGFDPTQLNLASTEETADPHNHVALENIDRRIHLLYGQTYGLQLVSSPGHGADITVILPIDTQGGNRYAQDYDR